MLASPLSFNPTAASTPTANAPAGGNAGTANGLGMPGFAQAFNEARQARRQAGPAEARNDTAGQDTTPTGEDRAAAGSAPANGAGQASAPGTANPADRNAQARQAQARQGGKAAANGQGAPAKPGSEASAEAGPGGTTAASGPDGNATAASDATTTPTADLSSLLASLVQATPRGRGTAAADPAAPGKASTNPAAGQALGAAAPGGPAASANGLLDSSGTRATTGLGDGAGRTRAGQSGESTFGDTLAAAQQQAGAAAQALGASATAPLQAQQNQAAAAGAAYTAQVAAPVGTPEFAPGLSAQVTLMLSEGVQQASLQLNPPDMGPVTVQIQIDGNNAQVNLSAEQAGTRQALEQALPELAGALREEGLTLTGGGVFEQPPGQPGRDAGDQARDRSTPGRADGRSGDAGIDTGTPATTRGSTTTARGLVDLVA